MSALAAGVGSESGSESEDDDDEAVMARMKAVDLDIAMSIAACAGLLTHDKLGNPSEEVWAPRNAATRSGKLVEAKDVRKLLLEQIKLQLAAKQDLLTEIENDAVVCTWIKKYTAAWEQEYNKGVQEKFDIGRKILSVMHDTLFEVKELLNVSAVPVAELEAAAARAAAHDGGRRLFRGDDAVVRFLFRNVHTRFHMVRIAGRLLQKKEVCNRAGTYSARQQRHDITQEKDDAVRGLYNAIRDDEPRFALCRALMLSRRFAWHITDHIAQYGAPGDV
jgi:hypothetical protein